MHSLALAVNVQYLTEQLGRHAFSTSEIIFARIDSFNMKPLLSNRRVAASANLTRSKLRFTASDGRPAPS